ncbi:hypothetical protein BGX34_002480 [Mortierella sp. NVP85]|nr:hypothetical protein BGX34_002480 [Mortierella sp. NVP85]
MTMEVIQYLRLSGTTNVEEIPCDQVDGENIIYWQDIKEVFPGVQFVKHCNRTVKKLKDSKGNMIEPHRIKYHPDVLDVVLHAAFWNRPVEPSMSYAALSPTSQKDHPSNASASSVTEDVVENLQTVHPADNTLNNNDNLRRLLSTSTPPSRSSSGIKRDSKASLSFREVVRLAQKKSVESEVEQRLVNSLPSAVQVQVRDSINIHDALLQVIRNGLVVRPDEQLVACLQELRGEVVKNNELSSRILDLVSENNGLTARVVELQEALGAKQDEMKQLQIQALDRLALLQNSVRALMTQTYELHEYPIPRLFIVLPSDSSTWNPLDLFSNNFRLYFLCECGEHTKSTNSKIPHHIHVAKHEGYDIARPKAFFQRYGSYTLIILRMLKFGITVAGVAIPALSQLIQTDAMDQAVKGLKELTKFLEPGMDQVISYIENVSEDEGETVQGFSEQMANNEALEGADLRQLGMFLKKKDENRALGNLYRTVTTEGHVKWVCIDHYRENYHEKAAKELRDLAVTLNGSFDENTGRVHVGPWSRLQAEQFYLALEKAKSVYELDIRLYWDTTQSDFKRLRDILAKTNVGLLTFYTWNGDGPTNDILNRNHRYDPVFDIMRQPSVQSVEIQNCPMNFIKRSGLQSRKDGFPNLRHLNIGMDYLKHDLSGFKSLVARTPRLSSLTINNDGGYFLEIYNAIAEHHICPVFFPSQSLCIFPPTNKSPPIATHLKDKADFLKVLGGRIDTVVLTEHELDDTTVAGFAKATEDGSRLKELTLQKIGRNLSEQCITDLASIVSRSELRKIEIYLENDEGRVRILESIQWEHIRELKFRMEQRGFETQVMKALVNGAKEVSGRIELEVFHFHSENDKDVSLAIPEDGFLEAFLSLTSLKKLLLVVEMTFEQILSLLKSVDFSRIEILNLWARDFDSAEVDAVLECLQDATELSFVRLWHANITDEQREWMTARGIQLSRFWTRVK